jgi:acetyl-CoA carboxylase carboxyl transferase subunit alpha
MDLKFELSINDLEQALKTLEQALIKEKKDPEKEKNYQSLKNRYMQEIEKVYNSLSAWDIVKVARNLERPQFLEYKENLFDNFIEIHGDRFERDEKALIAGFATIDGEKVMILGQQRGKTVNEAIKLYNKGSLKPNGFLKALRVMEIANRFNLPIITFIDTSGADPGIEAEEKGQGAVIAKTIKEMSRFKVPIISIVIGEGGSGGALGIGVANTVMMLKYSIYSVISPEGAAAILFRDGQFAPKAAENLHITADQLYALGLIDDIVYEAPGGAHRFPYETMVDLKEKILSHLRELKKISRPKLAERRLEKYLKIGKFL